MHIKRFISGVSLATLLTMGMVVPSLAEASARDSFQQSGTYDQVDNNYQDDGYIKMSDRHWKRGRHHDKYDRHHGYDRHDNRRFNRGYNSWPYNNNYYYQPRYYTTPPRFYGEPSYYERPRHYSPYYPPRHRSFGYGYGGPSFYFEYSR